MARAEDYRLELRVGLLILAGLIALVGVILVSERFSFEDEYQVTAFLRDAGGLRTGSPVTLAGLPIGKVTTISTDSGEVRFPVKVILSIKETYRLPAASTLAVATSGIFGDAYLAFTGSGSPAGNHDLLPVDGSAKVHATRGFMDTATQQGLDLLESLNDLLDPDARTDTKRLLHGSADLAEEAALLTKQWREQTQGLAALIQHLDDTAMGIDATQKRLAPNIEEVVTNLGSFAKRGEAVLTQVEATLATIDRAAAGVDTMTAENRESIAALLNDLRTSAAAVAHLADGISQGEGLLGRLIGDRSLARDVSDLSLNLVQVSELILEHPEALVFGMSKEDQVKWRERRDKLRLRRSFQNGYPRTPEPDLPTPSLLEQARAEGEAKR
jgi:virulence factor Mce-like protein